MTLMNLRVYCNDERRLFFIYSNSEYCLYRIKPALKRYSASTHEFSDLVLRGQMTKHRPSR